jgi:hypothetical protein
MGAPSSWGCGTASDFDATVARQGGAKAIAKQHDYLLMAVAVR